MGLIDKIEDAAGAVVEGAKDLLGIGEEEQPAPVEDLQEVAIGGEAAVPESSAVTETTQTYTVQAGDTLSKISKAYYGDSNEYMKIFEANRDVLSDPDEIKAGQELVIPNA